MQNHLLLFLHHSSLVLYHANYKRMCRVIHFLLLANRILRFYSLCAVLFYIIYLFIYLYLFHLFILFYYLHFIFVLLFFPFTLIYFLYFTSLHIRFYSYMYDSLSLLFFHFHCCMIPVLHNITLTVDICTW